MPFGFNQGYQQSAGQYHNNRQMNFTNQNNGFGRGVNQNGFSNGNQQRGTMSYNSNFFSNNSNPQNGSRQQTQQYPANPPMLGQPTVVPYLGKPYPQATTSMPTSSTTPSSNNQQAKASNQSNIQSSQVPSVVGQPVQNFPFISMPPASENNNNFNSLNFNIESSRPPNVSPKDVNGDNNFSTTSVIKNFIQNERNGNVFYDYLSSLAKNSDMSKRLKIISTQCLKHHRKYKDIYKELSTEDFEAVDELINTSVSLQNGLQMAMLAETDALRNLSDLINSIDDYKIKEQLTYLLYNKLWIVNYVNVLYSFNSGI